MPISFRRMIAIPEDVYKRDFSSTLDALSETQHQHLPSSFGISAATPSSIQLACMEENHKQQQIQLQQQQQQTSENEPQTQTQINEKGQLEREDIIEKIKSAAPKSYLQRAIKLYHWLRSDTNVQWSSSGEVFTRSLRLTGSNIVSLIIYSVNEAKSNAPEGWQSFVKLLKQNNVPRSILAKKTIALVSNDKSDEKTQVKSKRKGVVSKKQYPARVIQSSKPKLKGLYHRSRPSATHVLEPLPKFYK